MSLHHAHTQEALKVTGVLSYFANFHATRTISAKKPHLSRHYLWNNNQHLMLQLFHFVPSFFCFLTGFYYTHIFNHTTFMSVYHRPSIFFPENPIHILIHFIVIFSCCGPSQSSFPSLQLPVSRSFPSTQGMGEKASWEITTF